MNSDGCVPGGSRSSCFEPPIGRLSKQAGHTLQTSNNPSEDITNSVNVAEQLINPFGDDDEDFELNWLIDRHTKVSYLGVDTLMTRCPPLMKDKYFDDVDVSLPYTGAAFAYKKKTYRGSVHDMQVPEDQQSMFLPEIIEEDEEEEGSTKQCSPKTSFSSIHNDSKRGKNGNNSQTAEGIWRIDSLKLLHEAPFLEENMEQCMEMGIGLETDLPEEISVQNQSDIFAWPSNSTLESCSSTLGFQVNEMNELVNCEHYLEQTPGTEHGYNTKPVPRVQRSISSHFAKPVTGTGSVKSDRVAETLTNRSASKETLNESARKKWQKIMARRQSSSSGQWKGVRWKPVLPEATDSWSDNSALPALLRHQQMRPLCVRCLTSEAGNKLPTPAASSPILVQVPLHHVVETNTTLDRRRVEVIGASLPNISVPFSISSTIPAHSNSLKTIPPLTSTSPLKDEEPESTNSDINTSENSKFVS